MEFARVYKLESSNGLVYYGSTTQKYLSVRLCQHKSDSKDCTKHNTCASKLLYADGASVTITLVENVKDCKDKYELQARERWYIENNECVNKVVPGRTRQEYRVINRERHNETNAVWYEENKERLKEKAKLYRVKNQESLKVYHKEYNKQNATVRNEYRKTYREKNRAEISTWATTKIKCECGCTVSKTNLSAHRKTDRHKKAMAARVIFRFIMLYK